MKILVVEVEKLKKEIETASGRMLRRLLPDEINKIIDSIVIELVREDEHNEKII